jgi:hypothetical protein
MLEKIGLNGERRIAGGEMPPRKGNAFTQWSNMEMVSLCDRIILRFF